MNDSGAAPNWYPDPTGHNELRYWDGQGWTEHISNRGQQGTDPLAAHLSPSADSRSGASTVADVPGADATDEKQGMFARMRGERRAKAAGRDEFESTALAAAHGDAAAMQALPKAVAEGRNLYRGSQFDKKLWRTMAVAVRSVIDDDILSVEEEEHLVELGNILARRISHE